MYNETADRFDGYGSAQMNEVEEISKLDLDRLPKLKPFLFDHLHRNVLKNLYFE